MAMATSSSVGCGNRTEQEASRKDFGSSESIVLESPEDAKFDAVVGELENMLLDPEFLEVQKAILKAHCDEFDYEEENKLIYTDIFKEWAQKIENFVEQRLRRKLPWFSMAEFTEALRERPDQVDGDVFEVLATLGDFAAFKEVMLSYKHEQDGTAIDLSGIIVHTPAERSK